MNMEPMKTVFSDEAFVKGLFALGSAAEVQAALKERGELSERMLEQDEKIIGGNTMSEIENTKNSAELSDQALSNISGGTADNFELEKALKGNEKWLEHNGTQTFGRSGSKFG